MSHQIEYSIPFVGFPWRTDLFSIHNKETTPRSKSFADEICTRLKPVHLPGRTFNAVLNMASSIDEYEQILSDPGKIDVVKGLGLGDTYPKVPYDGISGVLSAKLANIFIRAVIIDRILWALCIGIVEPFTRYINDDFPSEGANLDMADFEAPIASIAQYLAVCEDRPIEFSSSLTGDNLRCGVSTVKHEGLARFHNVASQLYYAANLMLFLGTVRELYCIYSFQG
jgi:hypothetical protein